MLLRVHPVNPQERLIEQSVKVLENRKAIERVYQLKQVDPKKPMSIICPDLSVLSEYSINLGTPVFRILKRLTPGPYTFILEASGRIPRMMLTKQRTIGIRVPDNPICQALLRALGRPILSTSITLEDETHVVEDPDDIYEEWGRRVDMVIDGGTVVTEPSSVIDLSKGYPEIIRQGKGDLSSLL